MRWIEGKTPSELDTILAVQTLFATKKSNGGVRPIAVGAFLRRLALKAVSRCMKKDIAEAAGAAQYALGRAGGADAAFKAILMEVAVGDEKAVLSLDVRNAYDTVDCGCRAEGHASRATSIGRTR